MPASSSKWTRCDAHPVSSPAGRTQPPAVSRRACRAGRSGTPWASRGRNSSSGRICCSAAIRQSRASPAFTANSSAFRFSTGSAPGQSQADRAHCVLARANRCSRRTLRLAQLHVRSSSRSTMSIARLPLGSPPVRSPLRCPCESPPAAHLTPPPQGVVLTSPDATRPDRLLVRLRPPEEGASSKAGPEKLQTEGQPFRSRRRAGESRGAPPGWPERCTGRRVHGHGIVGPLSQGESRRGAGWCAASTSQRSKACIEFPADQRPHLWRLR